MLIEQKFGFDPGRERMLDACVQECLLDQYDPVGDRIEFTMRRLPSAD